VTPYILHVLFPNRAKDFPAWHLGGVIAKISDSKGKEFNTSPLAFAED